MIRAWRIVKARHALRAFTGEGAHLYGGRWNSPGVAVVYTAGSAALATLEMLIHLETHEVLRSYFLAEATFPESLVEDVDLALLPSDWRSDPAPQLLRGIGDRWAYGLASVVLRVPSVLVQAESNYLLNPLHPDFVAVNQGVPQAFTFDPRLIKNT